MVAVCIYLKPNVTLCIASLDICICFFSSRRISFLISLDKKSSKIEPKLHAIVDYNIKACVVKTFQYPLLKKNDILTPYLSSSMARILPVCIRYMVLQIATPAHNFQTIEGAHRLEKMVRMVSKFLMEAPPPADTTQMKTVRQMETVLVEIMPPAQAVLLVMVPQQLLWFGKMIRLALQILLETPLPQETVWLGRAHLLRRMMQNRRWHLLLSQISLKYGLGKARVFWLKL